MKTSTEDMADPMPECTDGDISESLRIFRDKIPDKPMILIGPS